MASFLTGDSGQMARAQERKAKLKWEYRTFSTGTRLNEADNELRRLGGQGWELVTVTPWVSDGDTLELYYYMKKPY